MACCCSDVRLDRPDRFSNCVYAVTGFSDCTAETTSPACFFMSSGEFWNADCTRVAVSCDVAVPEAGSFLPHPEPANAKAAKASDATRGTMPFGKSRTESQRDCRTAAFVVRFLGIEFPKGTKPRVGSEDLERCTTDNRN